MTATPANNLLQRTAIRRFAASAAAELESLGRPMVRSLPLAGLLLLANLSCRSVAVPAYIFADTEAWASLIEAHSVFIELGASNLHRSEGLRTIDVRAAVRAELSHVVPQWRIVESEEAADIVLNYIRDEERICVDCGHAHDTWYWRVKLRRRGSGRECRIEGENKKTAELPERTMAKAIRFILEDGPGGGPP